MSSRTGSAGPLWRCRRSDRKPVQAVMPPPTVGDGNRTRKTSLEGRHTGVRTRDDLQLQGSDQVIRVLERACPRSRIIRRYPVDTL